MNGLTEQRKITLAFLIGLVVGIGVTWMWYATEPSADQQSGPAATGTPQTATNTPDTEEGEQQANEPEQETQQQNDQNETEQTDDTDNQQTTAGNGDSITVERQVPGDTVTVEQVTFSEAGWIAIHERTDDGELGNVLGAKWEPAGEQQAVSVPLLRGTEGAQEYSAVLYQDNGNKEFDLEGDAMITQNGEPVSARFETMSGAAGN
jgi:hypothetical protein